MDFSLQKYGWILVVVGILLLTAIVSYSARKIFKKISNRHPAQNKLWEAALIQAVYRPLQLFIWLIGLSFAVHFASSYAASEEFFYYIKWIRSVGIALIIVWFLIGFIRDMERNLSQPRQGKPRLDRMTLKALGQILRVVVVIVVGLILLQSFGVPITGVLAFGGMGGIAAGFAAKDLLMNVFGGFMIFFDRPFNIGDWIRSPDRNIEGTVENIGWRLTRIRTFDKRPLYVPNSIFSNISVENPGRMQNRRIRTEIGIRYQDADKVAKVVKDIEMMLQNHPEIDTKKVLFVRLIQFAPSSLTLLIYTFTKTTDWVTFQAIQEDVFLKVIEIVKGNGADFAFPTSTVHLANGGQDLSKFVNNG